MLGDPGSARSPREERTDLMKLSRYRSSATGLCAADSSGRRIASLVGAVTATAVSSSTSANVTGTCCRAVAGRRWADASVSPGRVALNAVPVHVGTSGARALLGGDDDVWDESTLDSTTGGYEKTAHCDQVVRDTCRGESNGIESVTAPISQGTGLKVLQLPTSVLSFVSGATAFVMEVSQEVRRSRVGVGRALAAAPTGGSGVIEFVNPPAERLRA